MHRLFTKGLKNLNIKISEEIVERELWFLDELLRWNKRINLTSITNREEALEKHLLDSLVLLSYLPTRGRLLDMGSGGGFPGIPLAIASTGLDIVSIDSVGKKINFQKHVKRTLTLENIEPICDRIENVKIKGTFDFVVARALSDLGQLLSLAAPFLKKGGQLWAMKGPEGDKEVAAYLKEKQEDRFQLTEKHQYFLPQSSSQRYLYVLTKVED